MTNLKFRKPKHRALPDRRPYLILIVVVAYLLSLAACASPTVVSKQPTPTSSICLVGIWSNINPETFYKYSLPPGSFDLTTLTYKGSAGGVGYRFDSKGVLTVEAVGFIGKFDVKEASGILPLEIKINGFASGTYTIDGDTVRLDKVLNSEMDYSATYAKEPMMGTKKIDDFAPLFLPPYTTAKFECSSDKLTLQIVNFPGYQEKIEFQRLIQ